VKSCRIFFQIISFPGCRHDQAPYLRSWNPQREFGATLLADLSGCSKNQVEQLQLEEYTAIVWKYRSVTPYSAQLSLSVACLKNSDWKSTGFRSSQRATRSGARFPCFHARYYRRIASQSESPPRRHHARLGSQGNSGEQTVKMNGRSEITSPRS
jgi:hypothetical protein